MSRRSNVQRELKATQKQVRSHRALLHRNVWLSGTCQVLILLLLWSSCAATHFRNTKTDKPPRREAAVTFVPSATVPGCAGNPPSRSLSKPEMEQLARLLKSTVFFKMPVMLDFSSASELPSMRDLPSRYAKLASDGSLILVEPNHMVQYYVDKRESSEGDQWILRVCRESE